MRCRLYVTQILQQIKGIIDDDDNDDAEPDYDMLTEVTQHRDSGGFGVESSSCAVATSNPDVISCGGGGESQRMRPQHHLSSKTLRGAFVKRYNALSKRSTKNKTQRRPGLQQVFDNATFHRDHV